jgi:hypothetical protein
MTLSQRRLRNAYRCNQGAKAAADLIAQREETYANIEKSNLDKMAARKAVSIAFCNVIRSYPDGIYNL